MTWDVDESLIVFFTFLLVLVMSGGFAAMPSRPRARSWPPRYRPAPPPAPPARRDHGSERKPVAPPLRTVSVWHGGECHAGVDANTRRLEWAPYRCEYCGRRGVAGAAECAGCGAASTSAAVQLVGDDEPRLSPNVDMKW